MPPVPVSTDRRDAPAPTPRAYPDMSIADDEPFALPIIPLESEPTSITPADDEPFVLPIVPLDAPALATEPIAITPSVIVGADDEPFAPRIAPEDTPVLAIEPAVVSSWDDELPSLERVPLDAPADAAAQDTTPADDLPLPPVALAPTAPVIETPPAGDAHPIAPPPLGEGDTEDAPATPATEDSAPRDEPSRPEAACVAPPHPTLVDPAAAIPEPRTDSAPAEPALAPGTIAPPTPHTDPPTRPAEVPQVPHSAATTPSAPAATPSPPAPIVEPYRDLALELADETGDRYRAHDPLLLREVSIHVPSAAFAAAPERVARLVAVAQRLAGAAHPNLTAVYAIDTAADGRTAIVGEHVQARPLDVHFAERRAQGEKPELDEPYVLDLLIQAARGLDAAARHGALHGDVRPSRLLVTATGLVKVTGFGLALPIAGHHAPPDDGAADDDDHRDATPVEVAGHPDSIAPERIVGKPVTPASDQYSLGASFYELVAGRPPYPGSLTDKLLYHVTRRPTPLRRVVDCSPALSRVIQRMLERDPAQRFPSYGQLLATLQPLVPGHSKPLPLARRAEAMLTDSLVFPAAYGLTLLATWVLATILPLVATVLCHAAAWLALGTYYVAMMQRFGQTVGKMAFRCRLHDVAGRAPTRARLVQRFLLSYAPPVLVAEGLYGGWWWSQWGPIVGGILLAYIAADALAALLTPARRMLHDHALDSWMIEPAVLVPTGLDDYAPPAEPSPAQVDRARQAGARLGEHAVVLGKLGAGGMGEVYSAYDESLARTVAVKVIAQDRAADPKASERLEREARVLASIEHPNLVRVFRFDSSGDRRCFTMELVRGRSLAQELEHHGPLEVRRAIDLLLQAAAGLAAAQAKGVIHRDVKPSNLIVTPEGQLKVIDFGLACFTKVPGEPAPDAPPLTPTGIVLGTPHYLSPEQARGEEADHRGDIYSLGASFYHLLTGEYPYTARTPMALAVKHLTEPFPMKALARVAPTALCQAIKAMMAKDPAQRPQDYAALSALVKGSRPTDARPALLASRLVAFSQDLVLVLGGWAVGLVVGLALAARAAGGPLVPETTDQHQNFYYHFEHGYYWVTVLIGLLPTIHAAFALARHGATPGMGRLGMALVSPTGTPSDRRTRLAALAVAPQGFIAWIVLLVLASKVSGALAAVVVLAIVGLAGTTAWRLRRGESSPFEQVAKVVVAYTR